MTKNIKKLLITVCIMLFAFCLSFAWPGAFATDAAASTDTAGDASPAASTEGDIIDLSTLTQNLTFGADKTYSFDGGVSTLTYEGNITLTGKTSYSVFFNRGTHDVIFNNVDIQNKTDVVCVEMGAFLNLTVHGNNILKNSGEDTETGRPGLCVGGSGATLTITAASTGKLTAEGGMNSAGIGSRIGQHSFRVSILGGTVVASSNGEYGGAGIGSGYKTRGTGFINIENANVTATGGSYAAGIGMGYDATCSLTTISIKNSTVVAYGAAAGIGGGTEASHSSQTLSISIEGSTVTANGEKGAGIGDSAGSTFTDITIKNSTVTAFSHRGSGAAGIGSSGYITSEGYDEGTITIQDSIVTAIGGYSSAGIGGGYATCNGPIIIDRSNIYAIKGEKGDSDVGAGTGGYATTTAPTNSSGKALSLITITLAGVKNDIPIAAIEGTTDYGTVDLKTIGGKLYLYLPSGDLPTKVIANGNAYTGTVIGDVGTFTFVHTCEVGAKGAEATCTESAICGACLQYFGEVNPEAHAWDSGEITEQPTCMEQGVRTYTCTHNSAHIRTEPVAIDPEAHAWDSGEITEQPTCMEQGVRTYACTHNSAHTRTEPVAIDPEAHAWDSGEVTKQPTCTEPGVKTYTCTRDSSHTKTEDVAVDPDNHRYGEWTVTKEATVTEAGEQTRTCACGHTQTEIIPATGLSGGVIAGIVIGSGAVLGGGGFVIYWFVFKKRRS